MTIAINFNHYPKFYSFITFRPEHFGALVFNPYTSTELTLDNFETEIARMLTGEFNINDIIENYAQKLIINTLEARNFVIKVINKLEYACMIKLFDLQQSKIFLPEYQPSLAYYSAPKSAIWDITYLCNLKCPHCLTSSGSKHYDQLNTGKVFKVIENLADAKLLYLSFAGGEPFLRKDLPELIQKANLHNIRVDIASNGVEITQDMLISLRDLPIFHIQISIDGLGSDHDNFRGRKGAFENILKNIKRLKEEGISISISTTATSQNYNNISKIIDFAVEVGAVSYKTIPFLPVGRGKINSQLKMNKQQYEVVCKTLVDKSREYAEHIGISSETTFSFIFDKHTCCETSTNTQMGCSAGYDTLSIGADGTAFPCPFLQKLPIGNLCETSLKDIWNNSMVLKKLRNIEKKDMNSPCNKCKYAPSYCRGGCRAAAYEYFGDLNSCDPLCPLCNDKKRET